MAYERIDSSKKFDDVRASHESRYHIAAGFICPEDTVLDACCGTRYGMQILMRHNNEYDKKYTGIDKKPPENTFCVREFDFEKDHSELYFNTFDVFVGLECIEHLNDRGVQEFVKLAHTAHKWIVISTPVIQNSNPYHKQQFSHSDIVNLFDNDDWGLFDVFDQHGTYGIFIFKRINI